MMENNNTLYFDGNSARPLQVRAQVFQDCIRLTDYETNLLILSFPLAGTSHNRLGSTHYLYLDSKGLQYLQFFDDHPLAADIAKQIADANPSIGQNLLRQKLILLVPLALALGVGLYFFLVALVPFLGMRIIGKEQEITLGNNLMETMLQQERLLGATVDVDGTGQLQAFADHLKLSSKYPIRVTLLNSQMVNAYAMPGGNIVVYSGILEKIETPEELVALLAHESTHVNERHSLKSLLRSAANGILISILLSDASGVSGALATHADRLQGLSYSRSLESEADKEGMELMLANKVNPDGMRQLMQTLQKQSDIPEKFSFLSSHPLTKERIKNAELFINKHSQKFADRNDLKTIFNKLKGEDL